MVVTASASLIGYCGRPPHPVERISLCCSLGRTVGPTRPWGQTPPDASLSSGTCRSLVKEEERPFSGPTWSAVQQ